VLARAQQHAVWDRVQAQNKLRHALRELFPAALAAFDGAGRTTLDSRAARVVLAAAPTPDQAGQLTLARLRSLLRQAGRQRGVEAEARRLREVFAVSSCASQPRSRPRWGGA
jgi:hypothetical protein